MKRGNTRVICLAEGSVAREVIVTAKMKAIWDIQNQPFFGDWPKPKEESK